MSSWSGPIGQGRLAQTGSPVRSVLRRGQRPVLPVGPKGLLRLHEGSTPDRARAADRPGRPTGRGPGLPRQHRRPSAFTKFVDSVNDTFRLSDMGDGRVRGMITSARGDGLADFDNAAGHRGGFPDRQGAGGLSGRAPLPTLELLAPLHRPGAAWRRLPCRHAASEHSHTTSRRR